MFKRTESFNIYVKLHDRYIQTKESIKHTIINPMIKKTKLGLDTKEGELVIFSLINSLKLKFNPNKDEDIKRTKA